MRELPNRIVIHLENSLDDEKEFIKDIMRFGLMSRHVCAVALLNAFRNEIEIDKKKALAVEIAHQRYMAMEDVIQICTALRVSAGDASTTIHFEIERQYKDSKKKETLASIENKMYLSELGLTKSKLHKMYTKHFNSDVTQTVIKCQWRDITDGHAKLIKIYNEYYHDLNTIPFR